MGKVLCDLANKPASKPIGRESAPVHRSIMWVADISGLEKLPGVARKMLQLGRNVIHPRIGECQAISVLGVLKLFQSYTGGGVIIN